MKQYKKFIKNVLPGLILAGISFFISIFVISCSNKSKKQLADPNLFSDGLSKDGIALFSLLDNYPALKSGIKKLEPIEFNQKVNASLELDRKDIPGALRSLSELLKNDHSNIRPTLFKVNKLLNRLRTGDPEAYSNTLSFFEKIRNSSSDFIAPLLPVDYTLLHYLRSDIKYIQTEYEIKLAESGKTSLSYEEVEKIREDKLKAAILKISNTLKGTDAKDLLTDVEDILDKSINKNENIKAGIVKFLEGFFDSSLLKDRVIKEKLIGVIEGLGNMMASKAGLGTGSKSPETVFKELVINVEKYYTVGGSVYDADSNYNETGYSTEIATILTDLYKRVRNLILTPSGYIKDSGNSVLSLLSVYYNKLNFTESINSVDNSITQLMSIDLNGKERASDTSSDSVSAIESLMFMLSLADIYGYYWNNDQEKTQITGMSGGIISLGDATHSLGSKISSPKPANGDDSITNLGLTAVLNTNYTEALNNGKVKRDGINYPIYLNTSALSLLEGESRGRLSSASDSVYTKTIPFVLSLIADTLYSGKAPYFNKNKKDADGNVLNSDGSIYRNSAGNDLTYKSSWRTASYKIEVEKKSKGIKNYAGLDGTESTNIANGTYYSIQEVSLSETDRALETDEEAFYKNFQWLLYQKRMVLVIPVHVDALGNEIREAVYATVVANGLKGLMNVKPYCTDTCSEKDSGIWLQAKQRIKSGYDTKGDLTYFSDLPGDSAFLIQVWGFGIAGEVYGFTDSTIYQQVFRLLFAKFNEPSRFYGPIPAPIKWNFNVMEKLGFISSLEVTPALVKDNWEKRNQLLPLVVALAKALMEQTDVASGKNAFSLLTELAAVLSRPYMNRINDPVALNDTTNPQAISIVSLKIRGGAGAFGIRSAQMPTADLYYPDKEIRGFFSVLIENQLRYQDGLFSLVGKGSTLSSLSGLLFELGKSSRDTMRKNFVEGLQMIVNELRLESEVTDNSKQFNIEASIKRLRDRVAAYPDSRPVTNLNDPSWDIFDDLVGFMKDYLSTASAFRYTDNLSQILDVLIDAQPTKVELNSMLSILGAMLLDPQTKTQDYLIRSLLHEDLPSMLPYLAPGGKYFVGVAESLSKPGYFLSYFNKTVRSDYSINALIWDLERFCVSAEVQMATKDKKDLFYSTAVLLEQFGGLVENGRKASYPDAYFSDQWNSAEKYNSYFDRLNFILSVK